MLKLTEEIMRLRTMCSDNKMENDEVQVSVEEDVNGSRILEESRVDAKSIHLTEMPFPKKSLLSNRVSFGGKLKAIISKIQ